LPAAALPLLVLVVALFAGGGWLLMTKQQELDRAKAALGGAQQQVVRLQAEQEELTQQLDANREELSAREERLASLRAQLSSASQELEQSRQDAHELKTRHEAIVAERDQLQGRIAGIAGERDELRARGERLAEEKEEMGRSVSRLRERLALLDRDYQKLAVQLEQIKAAPLPSLSVIGASGPMTNSSQPPQGYTAPPPIPQAVVELPPIIVRKDQAGMAVPVRGRVVEVNEPHGFIVVDKGSLDGVRVGMALELMRGGASVGRATVVRVRPQLAACDIVRARSPGPIQSGDVAVQAGP